MTAGSSLDAPAVPTGYHLRELAPEDGPAIARLADASPDGGLITFRPVFRVDPFLALTYAGHQSAVVVEREGTPGLVGLGMVETGDVVMRGSERPYALLHSLIVHPDARRQGVARAIIGWRLARVRERLGDDAVVIATIQKANEGSLKAASSWATQISEPLTSSAVGLRSSAPDRSPVGFVVRPLRAEEFEGFAEAYATARADFDLWPPADVEALARWVAETPVAGSPANTLWVVTDRAGNLLAGLGVTEVRRTTTLQVDALPLSTRILNSVLRIIPKGGSMEMVRLSRMWFRPGAEAAGRHLFDTMRWEGRAYGNVCIASYDPRGPFGRMLVTPRWLPKTAFNLAIRSPEPLRPDHPIDAVQ